MQNFPWILGCSYKKWGFSYQELWFSRKKRESESKIVMFGFKNMRCSSFWFIWRGRSFSRLVESTCKFEKFTLLTFLRHSAELFDSIWGYLFWPFDPFPCHVRSAVASISPLCTHAVHSFKFLGLLPEKKSSCIHSKRPQICHSLTFTLQFSGSNLDPTSNFNPKIQICCFHSYSAYTTNQECRSCGAYPMLMGFVVGYSLCQRVKPGHTKNGDMQKYYKSPSRLLVPNGLTLLA